MNTFPTFSLATAGRRLLLAALLLLANASAWAASGIFEGFVIANYGGADQYYRLQASGPNFPFNGNNLGTFGPSSTFLLDGAELKTFKNGTSDVTSARLLYRIYPTAAGPGALPFLTINLPFGANLANPGDQSWTETAAAVNVLGGISTPGNYTIEVYGEATANDGGPSYTNFYSNTGLNYKATFNYQQLCGTVYTIDNSAPASSTNYVSFDAAFSALNTFGVNCPVVIDVKPGLTYTAPTNVLGVIPGASAVNTVTIRRNPALAGANPVVQAGTGVNLPTSATALDAIIRLEGTDFVIFDGIDLLDPTPGTGSTATVAAEVGYGLFRASNTNGCQNNVIRNCKITLQKAYGATDGLAYPIGIYGADHTTAATAALAAGGATVAGGNSNNQFYTNTIENVNCGIRLKGLPAATTPFAGQDVSNDVGGSSAGTGNTIRNFVNTQAASNFSSAVRASFQLGLSVRYNTCDNAAGTGGAASTNALRVILFDGGGTGTWTASNNTVTISSAASNLRELRGIQSDLGSGANLVVDNNSFKVNIATGSSSSNVYPFIFNNALNSVTFTNNTWNNTGQTLATSGTVTFYNDASSGASTPTVTITGNTVTNVTRTLNSANVFYGFSAGGGSPSSTPAVHTITGNTVSNITLTGAGTFIGIRQAVGATSSPQGFVNNNTVSNINAGTGGLYAINFNYGDLGGTNISTVSNNTLSGLTSAAASGTNAGVVGLYLGAIGSNTSAIQYLTANGNSISTLSNGAGTGSVYGIFASATTTLMTLNDNVISGLSASSTSASLYGIRYNGGATLNLNRNTISGLAHSNATSGTVYGTYLSGAVTNNIGRNKIYDLSSAASSFTLYGLYALGGTTYNVSNNLVGDLRAPAGSGTTLNGLNLGGGTTHNIYYNTVWLSGTSSAATFGSAAALVSSTFTADLRNNIFINATTPKGSGTAVAYRRSGLQTSSNLVAASNNNLYYAGTPGPNNLIFADGTNNDQTLAAYQARVAALGSSPTRESNAITENLAFASTTGSSPSFLHLSAATPTKAESGAAAIAGLTDDFDAAAVRTGYPLVGQTNGGGTAPDIGADEGDFTPIATDLQALVFVSPATSGCLGVAAQTVTLRLRNVGTTTISFATTPLTVNGTGTNPAAAVTTFGPVTVSTGTLAPNATLDVVLSTTYNMASAGTHTFAASFSGGGDAYLPNNSLSETRSVVAPVAGTLSSDVTSFCNSSSVVLTLTGAANGDVQFEQNPNGSGWVALGAPQPAAPTLTATATGITAASTQFRAVVSCGALAPATAAAVTVTNTQPVVTSVPASGTATVCLGVGTTLSATAPSAVLTNRTVISQDFNTSVGPWSISNLSTVSGSRPGAVLRWGRRAAPYNYSGSSSLTNFSLNGSTFLIANADTGASGSVVRTRLTSPAFSLANYSAINLVFQQYRQLQAGDSAVVEISANGAAWVSLQTNVTSGTVGANGNPNIQTISLNAYAGQTNLRLRFRYRSGWGFFWALDNIVVAGTLTDAPAYAWTLQSGPGPLPGTTNTSSLAVNPTGTSVYRATVTYPALPCSTTADFTVTPTATTTWTGLAGTSNWYTAGNWDVCVPTAALDAVLPTGSSVAIASGTAAVRDLTLQGSATLAQTGASTVLDVAGALSLPSPAAYAPAAGTTRFSGSGAQAIPAATYFNLAPVGATPKPLGGNLSIANDLVLTNGLLDLGNLDATLAASTGAIVGADASHFIIQGGNGRLCVGGVGAGGPRSSAFFPIGTNIGSYTPASLTNTGTSDVFCARVADGVLLNGNPVTSSVVLKTWDIQEGTAGGSNVALTVQWNAADESAGFSRSLAAVAHLQAGFWNNQCPTCFGPASGSGPYSLTRTGLTSFSPFAVQDGDKPLPVELTRFEATRSGADALLTWATAIERNSAGFEVQASADGRSFRALTFIASAEGGSSAPRSYAYRDAEKSKAGLRYYRLRQVDMDGTASFSAVRVLDFGKDGMPGPVVLAAPNPFTETLALTLATPAPANGRISLTDATGRTLRALPVPAGATNFILNELGALPSGVYVLHYALPGHTLHVKVIK